MFHLHPPCWTQWGHAPSVKCHVVSSSSSACSSQRRSRGFREMVLVSASNPLLHPVFQKHLPAFELKLKVSAEPLRFCSERRFRQSVKNRSSCLQDDPESGDRRKGRSSDHCSTFPHTFQKRLCFRSGCSSRTSEVKGHIQTGHIFFSYRDSVAFRCSSSLALLV